MNDQEASSTMRLMLDYIKKHGDEKVGGITSSTNEEFSKSLNEYISEEKERLVIEYKNRL